MGKRLISDFLIDGSLESNEEGVESVELVEIYQLLEWFALV